MSTPLKITRILIVDDDESFRNAQKRTLRRIHAPLGTSLEITEATSGTEAMALLQMERIDCILLDHNMPGGTGLTWLTRLLGENKDLAIVMLTGSGSEQLAVEAMKNGAMDYLVKGSITPEELERAILNAIEKVALRRTIEEQKNKLMEAERQRVMIESLGTACHHIGQPATVISAYLQMMDAQETNPDIKNMIASCMEASDAMSGILQQLMRVSDYSASPYLPDNETESGQDNIIDID